MDVTLTESQFEFLTSERKLVFFVAGIGAGKSFVLAHKIINHVQSYPNSNILLVANIYQQLTSATVPALIMLLEELGLPYSSALGGAKKYIKIGNVTIFLYSLENYDNIRGIEVGLVVGDEIAFANHQAFNVIMGRLRCKRGSLQARFVSSPNGYNWLYDLINEGKATAIRGITKDNPFLPKEYYDSLVELYGGENSPLARQELFGEFVNLASGAVYYAFDRKRHVLHSVLNPNLPVYVGLDFNVEHMTATLCQFIAGRIFVYTEIVLENNSANTFDMAMHLKEKYGHLPLRIVPDSTGKARKTSAESGKSDIQILKDFGLTVLETQNPRIKDRHNSVNRLFMMDQLQVSPTCVKTIKELETLTHAEKEGDVSHLAVGIGYVVWKLAPLKPATIPSESFTNPFLKQAK